MPRPLNGAVTCRRRLQRGSRSRSSRCVTWSSRLAWQANWLNRPVLKIELMLIVERHNRETNLGGSSVQLRNCGALPKLDHHPPEVTPCLITRWRSHCPEQGQID